MRLSPCHKEKHLFGEKRNYIFPWVVLVSRPGHTMKLLAPWWGRSRSLSIPFYAQLGHNPSTNTRKLRAHDTWFDSQSKYNMGTCSSVSVSGKQITWLCFISMSKPLGIVRMGNPRGRGVTLSICLLCRGQGVHWVVLYLGRLESVYASFLFHEVHSTKSIPNPLSESEPIYYEAPRISVIAPKVVLVLKS